MSKEEMYYYQKGVKKKNECFDGVGKEGNESMWREDEWENELIKGAKRGGMNRF